MEQKILAHFMPITQEERAILNGATDIDRALYMLESTDVINSRKLLADGKLITVRPSTRFVYFPAHSHDYVELVYVCSGTSRHVVNGTPIDLQQGELLFLSQSASHSVLPMEEGDIAVNFIVLPDFFTNILGALGTESTPLRSFLVDCLCGRNDGPGYLYFRVASEKTVQNLVENLLLLLLEGGGAVRKMSQLTMTLLFLQLSERTQMLQSQEEETVLQVLRMVETEYAGCNLAEIAQRLHYDLCWLSRQIKRKTGKTFTQLVQQKRLSQAAFLLENTQRNVADISLAVGYENISYFHRLFERTYGCSPGAYRRRATYPQLQERT